MIESQQNYFTKDEIMGQPSLWSLVYKLVLDKKWELERFLTPVFQQDNLQIILTGAGSSAFIGEAAQGLVQQFTGINTKAIATTNIVTHPELSFQHGVPTLLISFARSGNSPESLETIRLANSFCDQIHHLVISCNIEGELAKYVAANKDKAFIFMLPEAANDKSLAMTGSFTSMLLSVLLISDLDHIFERESEVSEIIKQAELLLYNADYFCEIAKKDFQRVVFLGSGPMLGIARECHLKLQELTDGQIICKHDSFLGFRHGPRAVINEETLLVYLFSPNDFVYKYELDLALSIAKDPRNIINLSIGRSENTKLNSFLNIDLNFRKNQELNIVAAGLVGQLLGYYTSINKGLNPDNPSVSGSINRVVQGVNLYQYPRNPVK